MISAEISFIAKMKAFDHYVSTLDSLFILFSSSAELPESKKIEIKNNYIKKWLENNEGK
jgi:hypothetical protein